MAVITNIDAINKALHQEMERDANVVVLGEDVGINGGVFRATVGLYEKFGRERVVDTPMSEATLVGASVGMAALGLKPVAEIQFNGFMYLALNQLIAHASRLRLRSRGRFTSPIVLRVPWSGGYKPLEHHGESMETLLIHIPGLKVVMPATPYDTKGLLAAAIRDPDPVMFLEPVMLYRLFKEDVPDKPFTIPIGEAKTIREGKDISIITFGTMVKTCMDAVAQLEKDGIDSELIDLRSLSPWDEDAVLASVQKTGRCVVVHEASRTLGFGAEISARIMEKALLHLQAPVLRVTGPDVPMPLPKSEHYFIPTAKRVVETVKKVMEF